uniref:TPR_REGION domain-containing protein n=1 Tax=Bursaphelenchus xylophilus TaxID=6326 RepID=A0A1I7SRJ3_BURXY
MKPSGGIHLAYSTPNLNQNDAKVEHKEAARSLSDDDFHDAPEYWAHRKDINLLECIAEARIAMNLFLNNHFEEAEARLKPLSDKTMYHALGYSTLLFLQAMMTCDRLALCGRRRDIERFLPPREHAKRGERFAYAMLGRWDWAANHCKRLKDESRWSRCVYTYLLAIYINAYDRGPESEATWRLLCRKIPNIRLRIAGKSIPIEKFCERKSKRFLAENRMYLAHYEFLYFWNVFTILEARPQAFIPEILSNIEQYKVENPTEDPNDLSVYEFLRGVCYRALGELEKAESCFFKVIQNEPRLTDNFYLVPNSTFELSQIRFAQNNLTEAEGLLNKVKQYKGYSLENKLLFRVHAAMENVNKRKG